MYENSAPGCALVMSRNVWCAVPWIKKWRYHLRCLLAFYAFTVLVTVVTTPTKIKGLNWHKDYFHPNIDNRRIRNYSSSGKNNQRTKYILAWNTYWMFRDYTLGGYGNQPFLDNNCPVNNCAFTRNKTMVDRASALMFHIPQLRPRDNVRMPAYRPHGQLYVYFIREPPGYGYGGVGKYAGVFNITMSYRQDSDIPIPLGTYIRRKKVINEPYRLKYPFANRTRSVAWVVSKCDAVSHRLKYARQLQKYIDVDIYGKCGKMSCPPYPTGNDVCFNRTIAPKYKFYLGFENSVCRDYVTEKLYRTLDIEILPVVLGGTNYSRDAPPGSVINILDYRSPKELASYLKRLSSNESEYLKYFQWKQTYELVTATSNARRGFCKLCELLHKEDFHREYRNVATWWTKGVCRNEAVVRAMNNGVKRHKDKHG